MTRYVILRGLDSGGIISGPVGPGAAISALESPLAGLGAGAGVAVETAELTSTEVRDAQRDPGVFGVARAMPMKLIAPVTLDDAPEPVPAWGVKAVGAADSPFDGAGVKVAVLDTGIDAAHPAFVGVNLVRRDFTGHGDHDVNGHGTHCAGTIFGRDVDGTRIGIARGVGTALIGKVLGNDGSGSSDMLFDAMNWAIENNAQVISMSLGFDFPGFAARLVEEQDYSPKLATSVALEGYRMNLRVFDRLLALFRSRAAFTGGAVVCAASGNESERQISPDFEVSASVPAAAEGIVSVGALQQTPQGMRVADFSNTNPTVSAPGTGILSAKTGGGLTALNGTSMACPHVAGVAALWWQAIGQTPVPKTASSVEARLLVTARSDVFAPGVQIADRGQGLVQAPDAQVS